VRRDLAVLAAREEQIEAQRRRSRQRASENLLDKGLRGPGGPWSW